MNDSGITDFLNILSFLYFLRRDKPHSLWGGVKIEDAYQSFLLIANLSEEKAEIIFNYEGSDNDTANTRIG